MMTMSDEADERSDAAKNDESTTVATAKNNKSTTAATVVGHNVSVSLALNRDYLSSFFAVLGGCACLYLMLQEEIVITSHAIANVAILWIVSIGFGYLFQAVGVPPLLGSLVAGIILQNGLESFELSHRFSEVIETVGLCIILLISSTEIDIHAVANSGGVSLRLTFLPGLVEAVTTAAASHWMFGMPFALALSLGFILAAVSPAIVVPGMTNLQKLGLGVDKGIPSLVMAACAFDDIVAITGFTIALGVALDNSENVALSAIMHGPASIFLGVLSGCISGLLLAATRFSPHGWQRTAIAIEIALGMSFAYKLAGFDGSGAVGTLMMVQIAKLFWSHKAVVKLTKYSGAEFLDKVGHDINTIWDIVVRPLLFASIGAAFDLNVLPKESILKSCVIVVIGLACFRFPAAFLSAFGKNNFTMKERLFIGMAWTPKATVQAALCSIPLTKIMKTSDKLDNYNEMVDFGKIILSTSILAILITAPIGLLSIQFLGPYLLCNKAGERKSQHCEHQTVQEQKEESSD